MRVEIVGCQGNVTRATDFRIPLLPRDARHKRGLCRRAVSVRPSVCPSVTFVYSVETNEHIFKSFSPSVATPFDTVFQKYI